MSVDHGYIEEGHYRTKKATRMGVYKQCVMNIDVK